MKGFIGKVILVVILSIFLYRQRHYLLRLVLGIEVMRRLSTSINFKWMDIKEWLNNRQDDHEMDHV